MFRCASGALLRALPALLPVVVLSALLAPTDAPAQTNARSFSAQTLRGVLVVTQPPEVLLNGKPTRLSPGARIRDTDNLLQLSGALVGQKLLVHYTLESHGLVHNVWVLTGDEAARKPWPATTEEAQRWSFDTAAQAWTRK